MKKTLLVAGCCLLLWACQKSSHSNGLTIFQENLMPIDSINNIIAAHMKAEGQFEWKSASDRMLWSALVHAGHIASVGYRVDEEIGVPAYRSQRQVVRDQLLDRLYELEKKNNTDLQREAIELWPEEVLPLFNVLITSYEAMVTFRHDPQVRYLEPMDYETRLYTALTERQSGCAPNLPDASLVAGLDYGIVSPFAKASWNYPHHGLLDAWRMVSGVGITVFLIDTGISYEQENLGSQFNQGFSQKRRLERMVTLPRKKLFGIFNVGLPETPEDRCGHGTAMAGVLAAPRGTDGNLSGVAYNVHLVSCRAAEDVFIDEAREVRGVSDAFVAAANRADVHIISMSMGRITVSSQLRDAIMYARAKGKLIFCAAGTSMSFTASWAGVIFPATLSEVQAVTGVTTGSPLESCVACHSGPEVDFVVVMERAADKKHPLTLSDSGDTPSTIGGSSVATASMAGMAALLWSRYPWWSASELLGRLQQHSSYFPNRHSRWGWGLFQPAQAVN
ncbi:MAG: S8 family peptidase [Sphingomonadales bacterium]